MSCHLVGAKPLSEDWTNAEILLTGSYGINVREILIEILTFSFKKMHLKVLSVKWRPFLSQPQCVKTAPSNRKFIKFHNKSWPTTVEYAKNYVIIGSGDWLWTKPKLFQTAKWAHRNILQLFRANWIKIHKFCYKKMSLKVFFSLQNGFHFVHIGHLTGLRVLMQML